MITPTIAWQRDHAMNAGSPDPARTPRERAS
jgi:hypothetical protein